MIVFSLIDRKVNKMFPNIKILLRKMFPNIIIT